MSREEDRLARIREGDYIAFGALLDEALELRSATRRLEAWACMSEYDARIRVNERDGSVLVQIPGGAYPLSRARVTRELPTFWASVYPVTNAQYLAFMEATRYMPDDPTDHLAHWVEGRPRREAMECPVVYVSMLDALHYCAWAGLEVPGTWMWEAAAAGPRGERYPWGSQYPTRELAHMTAGQICVVGSYRRTRTSFGCQGMFGNVGEWCAARARAEGDLLGVSLDRFGGDSEEYDGVWAVARGYADRAMVYDYGCTHEERVQVNARHDWLGFRPVSVGSGKLGASALWGELRSLCHEGGSPLELAARVEYVLASVSAESLPGREVATYLGQHLPWLICRPEQAASTHVLANWLDGGLGRLFRLVHDAPTEYMLLTRCAAWLEEHVWQRQEFGVASAELDRLEELGIWLEERAAQVSCFLEEGGVSRALEPEQAFAAADTSRGVVTMVYTRVSLPNVPWTLTRVTVRVDAAGVIRLYASPEELHGASLPHRLIDFSLSLATFLEHHVLELDLEIEGLAERGHEDLTLLYEALAKLV